MLYIIKIFDIMMPNLENRPDDKSIAKSKHGRSQIKLKLPNNTN